VLAVNLILDVIIGDGAKFRLETLLCYDERLHAATENASERACQVVGGLCSVSVMLHSWNPKANGYPDPNCERLCITIGVYLESVIYRWA
jgi:hypothetical protein